MDEISQSFGDLLSCLSGDWTSIDRQDSFRVHVNDLHSWNLLVLLEFHLQLGAVIRQHSN